MAYTAPIDEASPAGTDDANTIDDQIRALKLAIKERLESFFEDIEADPLTVKDNLLAGYQNAIFTTIISMDDSFKYLNHGALPIKLPITGAPPAGGASMNNSIIIHDGVGLVLYMNDLRYHLTLGAAF